MHICSPKLPSRLGRGHSLPILSHRRLWRLDLGTSILRPLSAIRIPGYAYGWVGGQLSGVTSVVSMWRRLRRSTWRATTARPTMCTAMPRSGRRHVGQGLASRSTEMLMCHAYQTGKMSWVIPPCVIRINKHDTTSLSVFVLCSSAQDVRVKESY